MLFRSVWEGPEERDKYKMPWWAVGWWRVRTWRCPQAGLDNLEWQRNLRWKEEECAEDSPNIGELTPQAIAAQEILDLYKWWTEVYPNRPDPHDASGWTEYCARKRQQEGDGVWEFFSDTTDPELRALGEVALDKTREIEEAYRKEDEAMLIRLIKIRDSLWT